MHRLIGALLLAAPWTAFAVSTLHGRDLNGDGVADAYYDSVQDITWLADADYAHTSGYSFASTPWEGYHHVTGEWLGMALPTALNWAAGLNYHGVTGWRLPSLDHTCERDPVFGHLTCTTANAEMESLFARLAGSPGPFSNLPTALPFFQYGPPVPCPHPVVTDICMAASGPWGGLYFFEEVVYGKASWAVHDGDIAPVPEPATVVLTAVGLLALAWRRRSAN